MWTVPYTPTNQALVKVSDRDNPAVYDVSNNVFTISATLPATWSSQTSGTTSALYSVSIVDDQVAWTVGAGGVVRRTTNGGTNWVAVASLAGDAHQVFALSADVAFACVNMSAGNDARIYKTTNGGASWNLVYQNTGSGAFINGVWMFDDLNGTAEGDPVGGQWTLLKTTDGGNTWSPHATLAQAGDEYGWNNSFEWANNMMGWFGTNNYRVYRTTNGGNSWIYSSTPAKNSYGLAFPTSQFGMVGDSAGATAKTTNSGASWSAASNAGTGSMVMPAAVDVPDMRWWVTSGTAVYKTTNQGSTWTLDHSRTGTFNHIRMKVVQSANVIVGYAVGASGQISKYLEYLPITPTGKISGVKFEDIDGDGVKDEGEPTIAGWNIYLSGAGIEDTTETDAQGVYTFESLYPGSYTVSEESRAGWIRTMPTSPSYTITLGQNEEVTGKDFGNFKLGSISGMKWKDENNNGIKDIGEPGLSGWTIYCDGTGNNDFSTQTGTDGYYEFTGLTADTYQLSEELKSGYVCTYPPTCTHTVEMYSGLNATGLDFGNFYPPDTMYYRTFTADSFTYAKDNKGKFGKIVKRKPDRVFFKFNLTVPNAVNYNQLKLEFSMDVVGTIYQDKSKLEPIAEFSGKKPAVMTLSVRPGDVIQIDGMGKKGKAIKVKYAFGNADLQLVTQYKLNQPGLPMPNTLNLVYELFEQQAFAQTSGLVVGKVLTGIEALRHGWVQIEKYKDVYASLYKGGKVHEGAPTWFETFGTGPFVGKKKVCPPTKHDNKLFAEMLALRLNIVASAADKTPVGLGDLIYDDGSSSPFCGKTIFEIAAQADAYLTYGTPPPKPGVTAEDLYNVIYQINSAFEGPMDTISFADKLKIKGAKSLSDVPFLKFNAGIPPTTISLKPVVFSEEPSLFALHQNYPNPFNPSTTINFNLPVTSFVTLKVYNVLGQEVEVLLDKVMLDEGENSVEFNANNLANGVYFYKLVAEPVVDELDEDEIVKSEVYQSIKKAVLIK